MHYQVKGAKHGIRRYQNLDGSLTPAGRAHYGVGPPRGEGASKKSLFTNGEKKNFGFLRKLTGFSSKKEKRLSEAEIVKAKTAPSDDERKRAEEEEVKNRQLQEEQIKRLKAKAIASGDPKEILKWKDRMTSQELQDAVNRSENIDRLMRKVPTKKKTPIKDRIVNTADTVSALYGSYRKVGTVLNKIMDLDLPGIEEKKTSVELSSDAKVAARRVLDNVSNMSYEQVNDAWKAVNNIKNLQGVAGSQNTAQTRRRVYRRARS
jgi:hypothetical protein